jgi:hypothetical protein
MSHGKTATVGGNAVALLGGFALAAFALFSVMFLLQENGLILSHDAAHYLHELTHDARHALGVPCH